MIHSREGDDDADDPEPADEEDLRSRAIGRLIQEDEEAGSVELWLKSIERGSHSEDRSW